MAHSVRIYENERTGETRRVPEGFSWTALFFYPWVVLWRGDWRMAAVIWGLVMVPSLLFFNGPLEDIPTFVVGSIFFIVWDIGWSLVMGFNYNKFYQRYLEERGFKKQE